MGMLKINKCKLVKLFNFHKQDHTVLKSKMMRRNHRPLRRWIYI